MIHFSHHPPYIDITKITFSTIYFDRNITKNKLSTKPNVSWYTEKKEFNFHSLPPFYFANIDNNLLNTNNCLFITFIAAIALDYTVDK